MTNFNINVNQSPYFDDYDETKDFHQILYKAGFPVQARELTQEQTILRNQIKRFGNHIFQDGSKVTGGDITLNLEYEYVKLQALYNGVNIKVGDLVGKTVYGTTSGCRAIVLNSSVNDLDTGEPDTIFVKYISGSSVTTEVQGITITGQGIGYIIPPTVAITGGGGSGASGIAVLGTAGEVLGVNVTSRGSGYTSAPTVGFSGGSGSGAGATANINTSAIFSPAERIVSTNLAVTVFAQETSATGRGSAVSIDDGVFYIQGNFVRNGPQTIVLSKYSDRPTTKIGIAVSETIVDSGADSTLLDNAQGAYNFSAPGSDRLKISLKLITKSLTSVDDLDFFEMLRINDGLIQKDFRRPIYSELEKTLASRTYDESGNYTVRSFNIQTKDHKTDDTKFVVRIDPGKAFIEGKEYETFTGTDITIDKARTFTTVNNFDRLMQYGNYAVIKNLKGLFNISDHSSIDLHNVPSSSIVLTDDTTYASTKIGTAKVRNIDYVNTGVFNLYIYDIIMTSSGFSAVDSFFIPVDASTTPVVEISSCDIDETGRVGGVSSGAANMYETNQNSLVFPLSQKVIKTIRDDVGTIDTSFKTRRVFENVVFATGITTITTTGNTETFFGTGTLSDTNKLEGYLVTVKTVGTSGYTVGQVIDFTGGSQTITVNPPNNTTVAFDTGGTSNFTADIIATINLDGKQEKSKTLVQILSKTVATPNTVNGAYDSLDVADCFKIHAIYDSGDLVVAPIIDSFNLDNPSNDAMTVGEIVIGDTSNATGRVVSSVIGAASLQYIPITGTFVPETITGATSGVTKTVSLVVNGHTDVTSRYELDTGMRDNFYDHGRIKLKSGQIAPSGQITILFDYFTHVGVGYFSVDSYSSVDYSMIPAYISPTTGLSFELRDCVDFRPRRTDGGTLMQNIELPVPNTNWSADYSYYLPRTDSVYLSTIGTSAREVVAEDVFGNNKGIPSLQQTPPSRMDGTMDLYRIKIPAYTFKANTVGIEYIENKRYTMRDISNLEKRLSNVEYYTSLSLLERATESLVIKDGAGLDRFKSGILVDEFSGHSVGNVFSPDYKCSIDFQERYLRPPFTQNLTDIDFNSTDSTQIQRTGDLISLPYSSEVFIDQPLASKFINVNPFAVVAWIGIVELTPPNDNWIDTNTRPEVVVNLNGENDGWEQMIGFGFESQFNSWETIGTGRTLRSTTRGTTAAERRGAGNGQSLRNQTETLSFQQGSIERAEITGTETVRNEIGDRVTDVSIIPFIRARDVAVNVTGMKPLTQVYPFFDGDAISAYCTPSGGVIGDPLYTDESGSLAGVTFSLPNSDTLRFRVGDKQFLLLDNAAGDLVTASTRAEIIYQASGLLQQRENVVISTRVPRIERRTSRESRAVIDTSVTFFTPPPPPPPRDPLAETFFVDGTIYPNGIFLSSVDIYFKSKDTNKIPVTLEIRTTNNGYPSTVVVPFSDISKLPDDITTSEDASVSTNFLFDKGLVYLQPGEFSFVILSNSLEYEVFLAELGDNIIGTTRKVSEQPYVGSFFKSQNASTWTAEQNQDLAFRINKCAFSVADFSEAVFKNQIVPTEYKSNIIQIVPRELITSGTSITWGVKMTDVVNDTLDTTFFQIAPQSNLALERQKKITTLSGSYISAAQFASGSKHISPIIDLARNSVVTVENIVNNVATNETNAEGGDAFARYMTRRVNLKEGFDATSLKVYLTANRQEGTMLKVYYKILSQFDPEVFDDKLWTEMLEKTNMNNISADDSIEEYFEIEYEPVGNSTDYTLNSVTYDSFKTFAIKIVMLSSTTTRVPLVKNLRAIALA